MLTYLQCLLYICIDLLSCYVVLQCHLDLAMPCRKLAYAPVLQRSVKSEPSGSRCLATCLTVSLCLQDHSVQWITPLNAKSHGNLPPAHVVTNGFDPLRDVGHTYSQKMEQDGTIVNYVHHEDMTHGFIQFTEKSKRCLQLTRDIGHVLRDAL